MNKNAMDNRDRRDNRRPAASRTRKALTCKAHIWTPVGEFNFRVCERCGENGWEV